MQQFWEAFAPALGMTMGTVLIALSGWGLAILQKYTGVKIEEKHMNALHSALMTGAAAAVAKKSAGASQAALQQEVVQHVIKSVPDAIKKLNPSDEVLGNLAMAAVERVINPTILIGDGVKALSQVLRR